MEISKLGSSHDQEAEVTEIMLKTLNTLIMTLCPTTSLRIKKASACVSSRHQEA